MTRQLKIAGLALGAMLVFAPLASAQRGFGFRGGWYGPGIGFYGPGWYGPGYWYGAGWYGYGPYGYGYGPYADVPHQVSGKIKIDVKAKDSKVYVDGGYAGTVKELGTFRLRAGAHDIELRHPDDTSFFTQHVNVIGGSTTDIKITNTAPGGKQG
jgi:hypothetical protein